MNGKRLAEALQALIAERRASGRVFEREYPKLAAAIDEVLHIFRAGQR